MANVAVAGFIPVSRGGLTTPLVRKRVLTNNTTAIFKGDAVDAQTGGDIIVTAATNALFYSVAQAASYIGADGFRLERTYLPAATLYTSTTIDPTNASYVHVVEDMVNTTFKASVATGAIALTDLQLNYLMVLGAGSTTSGLSAHTLDSTSRNTTSTFPWRVQDFAPLGSGNNDLSLVNVHVLCQQNAGRRAAALGQTGT